MMMDDWISYNNLNNPRFETDQLKSDGEKSRENVPFPVVIL